MLNRLNRIGDSETIDALHQSGAVFKTSALLFRYRDIDAGPSRFAVSVSSKVHRTAVARNRLRRQINEALRIHLEEFPRPIMAMVSARGSLAGREGVPFEEVEKSIFDFIRHLKSHAK